MVRNQLQLELYKLLQPTYILNSASADTVLAQKAILAHSLWGTMKVHTDIDSVHTHICSSRSYTFSSCGVQYNAKPAAALLYKFL